MFKCAKCEKLYANFADLKQHAYACVNDQSIMFQCQYCPKLFNTEVFLNEHIGIVHPNQKVKPEISEPEPVVFKCKKCPQDFENEAFLKEHTEKFHQTPTVEQQFISNQLKFKCQLCPGNICCQVCKKGIQNQKDFWQKINISPRKLLYFVERVPLKRTM